MSWRTGSRAWTIRSVGSVTKNFLWHPSSSKPRSLNSVRINVVFPDFKPIRVSGEPVYPFLSAKSSFYLPAFEISRSFRTASEYVVRRIVTEMSSISINIIDSFAEKKTNLPESEYLFVAAARNLSHPWDRDDIPLLPRVKSTVVLNLFFSGWTLPPNATPWLATLWNGVDQAISLLSWTGFDRLGRGQSSFRLSALRICLWNTAASIS